MGIVENITIDRFPRQTEDLGKSVRVCFHHDIWQVIRGQIIRSDAEYPWRTIIRLVDDRVVLSTECMYSLE